MRSSVTEIFNRQKLAFQLVPISIRELLAVSEAPSDIYGLNDNQLFKCIIKKNTFINKTILRDLIKSGQHRLFIHHESRNQLTSMIQKALVATTRSLSINGPIEKAKKQMDLLTINLSYLYENPTNDELLNLQYQNAKNLAYFLIDKPDIHEHLYKEFIKQKHHYIFAQPLISSLFVLGVLKHSRMFADKDIENLFIASYFKDIGMSSIPVEKYNQGTLSNQEKELLSNHSTLSVKILQGRIPITPRGLKIIENHHLFSLLNQDLGPTLTYKDNETPVVSGVETMLVSIMDVISAMITGRPYCKASSLFEALELIKTLISNKNPYEFKLIVNYFRQFFF